jgi:hypothetical protein
MEERINKKPVQPEFSGHVYIFCALDVGDDINLEQVKQDATIRTESSQQSKFLQNHHIPLNIELPHPHDSGRCMNSKLYQFGVISLTYKVPISGSLQEMKSLLVEIDEKYQEQSVTDSSSIFKKIKKHTVKPHFFHLKNYYTVIQIDTQKGVTGKDIQEKYGHNVTSLVRFETQSLSEDQKQSILNEEIGYFSQDLVVIDAEAAFVYDQQYEDLLIFFEIGNIQQLELQYFNSLLDTQLNAMYEERSFSLPLLSYLPFIGSKYFNPLGAVNRLQVEISVITERFEAGVKIVGEPFYANVYEQLIEKLDIEKWKEGIEKKFSIIKEIKHFYQHKVDGNREDLLSVLIIVLIVIELIVALYK